MKKFLPKTKNNFKGFTLVELLVVISIIAVLSVIGITIFSSTQKTARDSRRRADVDALSKAIEAHFNSSQNQYCTANAGTYCAPVDAWFAGGSRPKDPQTNAYYATEPTNGVATYKICANLEAGATPGEQYCKSQQQ